MKTVLSLTLILACMAVTHADEERVWIDAKINNKPVRFFWDTASASPVVLFSKTAERLNLKTMSPDPRYPTIPGTSWKMAGPLHLDLGTIKQYCYLPVLKVPDSLHGAEDGVIGWPFIRQHFGQNPVLLDLAANKLIWITNFPTGLETWTKFQLETNLGVLAVRIFRQNGKSSVLVFDTGASGGIKLSPQAWRDWYSTLTNAMTTFNIYYTSHYDHVIAEQSWAKHISFGALRITDVPVETADSDSISSGTSVNTQFVALLGLTALKRLDIIVDNQNNVVYLNPKTSPPLPYEHNRLGAVFAPRYPDSNNVAHVAPESTAYEAGIRDYDVLLNNETDWNFKQPAGTKIEFTLKRGDKTFRTTATLRNILPPNPVTNLN